MLQALVSFYDHSIQKNPEEESARRGKIQAYLSFDRFPEARQACRELLKQAPNDWWVILVNALMITDEQSLDEGEKLVTHWTRNHEDFNPSTSPSCSVTPWTGPIGSKLFSRAESSSIVNPSRSPRRRFPPDIGYFEHLFRRLPEFVTRLLRPWLRHLSLAASSSLSKRVRHFFLMRWPPTDWRDARLIHLPLPPGPYALLRWAFFKEQLHDGARSRLFQRATMERMFIHKSDSFWDV
jgi:hypothetical protein